MGPRDEALSRTNPAHGAFTAYRLMSYDRSLAKVGEKLGKSTSLMERWSRRWLWRHRVGEYDRDQETIHQVALNTSIQRMAERQAGQAAAAVQRITLPHLALAKAIRDGIEAKQKGESDVDLIKLLALAQPGELIKLAQSTAHSVTILMQAERLARGEPIEIVRTQGGMMSLDVQITAAEVTATADILKESGFFDDYQLGSNSPVPADSETSETVAAEYPPDLPRIRFHDMRHNHTTLLLKAGVPIKVVSERLGHASVAFTMQVYQHVLSPPSRPG